MTPLELFVGRAKEIAAFEDLLDPASPRWVMLVTGLSGTGKSLLIDWLRRNRCAAVRHARVQLTPNTTSSDFVRLVATQLGPDYAAALGERLDALESAERQSPLVHVTAPSMTMEGKLGGRISGSTQTNTTNINLESAAAMEALERETRRLDQMIGALQPLGDDAWVLFVDEAEHLEGREFGRFLLERLVPRLRGRFPGFRLYMSGQSLPQRASFVPHESVRVELGELDADDTATLLARAGVTDPAVQARVVDLTSGHPLLLGMLIQDSTIDAGAFKKKNGRNLPDRLDQAAVTAWIYRRVLDRLPDAVRPIAADLALLDWFNLSILRATFGVALDDAAFRDLIRRSFVKSIGPGQWRCHDIVRRHLAAERRDADPDQFAAISEKAFEAFRGQMDARAEREGAPYFAGRLEYVRGALMGASGFSVRQAVDFITGEFLRATIGHTDDYLFGLSQMTEAEGLPKAIGEFGESTRRLLDRVNVGQSDATAVAFVERLAADADRLGIVDARDRFRLFALGLARQCRDWKAALRLAAKLVEGQPTVDNKLILARTHAEAGSIDEARGMFEAIRAEAGDTVEVLTALGVFSLIAGETDRAQRFFTDAIAAAPNGAEQARLQLAQTLFAADRDEEALAQVERLLEIAPQLDEAQRLRMRILAWLGRYQSLSVAQGDAAGMMREVQDHFAAMAADNTQGRILSALAEDSAAVPVPLLLDYGEVIAASGQEEALERIHAAVLKHAPEAKDFVELQKLTLLLCTNRPQLVVDEAEKLLERHPGMPGTYIVLIKSYQMLKRTAESRAVLARLTERFPTLQDKADEMIATSYLIDQDLKGALDYLQERADADKLGAEARVLHAGLLAMAGMPDQAREILERVIFTAGRDKLSVSTMIEARVMFARLLVGARQAEEAREIAASLPELFPNVPKATVASVQIHAALDDEAAVRAILRSAGDTAPLAVRNAALEALGIIEIRRHASSAEALLAAIKKEPQRVELIMALTLVAQNLPPDKSAEMMETAFKIAPQATAELQRMSMETMLADPSVRSGLIAAQGSAATPPIMRIGLTAALASRGFIELAGARAVLNAIAEQHPALAVHARIGEINLLLDLNRLDDAEALVAPYLRPGAMTEQAALPCVRYLKARGKWREAVRLLDDAARAHPAELATIAEMKADILIDHDAAEALTGIDALKAKAPLSIGLSMSRANALGRLARFDEAISTMADALKDAKIDPADRAAGLRVLGKWQVEAGRAGEAATSYRESITLQPKRAAGLVGLSKALEKSEQWSEAYAALRDAIALEPERLNDLEQRLQQLRGQAGAAPAPA